MTDERFQRLTLRQIFISVSSWKNIFWLVFVSKFGVKMICQYAPLVADLFLFSYERDFMMSLSDDKQADIIDAFNTTSRYLDEILNIDNVDFDNMVSQIYSQSSNLIKLIPLIPKLGF